MCGTCPGGGGPGRRARSTLPLAGPRPRPLPVAPLAAHPLRIAFLTSSRFWRGSSSVFAVLARGLNTRGHATVALVAYEPLAAGFRARELAVQTLPVGHTSWRGARALRHALRELAVDVVLVDRARDIRLAAVAALRRPLRIVYCISTPGAPRAPSRHPERRGLRSLPARSGGWPSVSRAPPTGGWPAPRGRRRARNREALGPAPRQPRPSAAPRPAAGAVWLGRAGGAAPRAGARAPRGGQLRRSAGRRRARRGIQRRQLCGAHAPGRGVRARTDRGAGVRPARGGGRRRRHARTLGDGRRARAERQSGGVRPGARRSVAGCPSPGGAGRSGAPPGARALLGRAARARLRGRARVARRSP